MINPVVNTIMSLFPYTHKSLETEKDLIKEQISKSCSEILFIKFIFSFVNCLSLIFVGLIIEKMYSNYDTAQEDYVKVLEVAAALFAPYIAFVAQGYLYPRLRKINILRFLLHKERLKDEDIKSIFDK